MKRPRKALKARKQSSPINIQQYVGRGKRFRKTWSRVTEAIAKMRLGKVSLKKAAKAVGISPGTVVRWGKSAIRKNKSGRYVAKRSDRLLRIILLPSSNGLREVAVHDSRQASLLGKYWNAVQAFLEMGDKSGLAKFEGMSVGDASGATFTLLTDTNELNRLGYAGVLSFESLYGRWD